MRADRVLRVSDYSGHYLEDRYTIDGYSMILNGQTGPLPWTRQVSSYFPLSKQFTRTDSSGSASGSHSSTTGRTGQGPSFNYLMSGSQRRRYEGTRTFANPPVTDSIVDTDTARADGTIKIIFRKGTPGLCLQVQPFYSVYKDMDAFISEIAGNNTGTGNPTTRMPPQYFLMQPGAVITYDIKKVTGGLLPVPNKTAYLWGVDATDRMDMTKSCTTVTRGTPSPSLIPSPSPAPSVEW